MEHHQADALYRRVISAWGEQAQLLMVVEESSEFVKELCKWQRQGMKDVPEGLIDEFADMEIMLAQLAIMCASRDPATRRRIEERKTFKLDRLLARLEAHG